MKVDPIFYQQNHCGYHPIVTRVFNREIHTVIFFRILGTIRIDNIIADLFEAEKTKISVELDTAQITDFVCFSNMVISFAHTIAFIIFDFLGSTYI